uniref:Putative sorting nexin-29 n=1 Tax=Anopheles triannulatus TaxID=58253 RepID=A0A2M4AHE3_9DIPT
MVGMSTFSSLTLESVIGISLGMTSSGYEAEQVRKVLIGELLVAVRDCQRHYGGKTELATEQDPRIRLLCEAWEGLLTYGLKQGSVASGILQNVVGELVALSSGSGAAATDGPVFWDFAYRHLTNHERERFSTLRHVWSACGKGRALLRAILNERALERYVLMWLSDDQLLAEYYEPWALLRNAEVQHLLPNVAAGLGTILFAIAFDVPELNVAHTGGDGGAGGGVGGSEERREPIIATRRPAGPVRKINAIERVIMDSASPSLSERGPPPPTSIQRATAATEAAAPVAAAETVSGTSSTSTITDDSCSSLTTSTVSSGSASNTTRSVHPTANDPPIEISPGLSKRASLQQTSEVAAFSVEHALVAIEQTTNRAASCDRLGGGIPELVSNHASSGLTVEDASEADDPLATTIATTIPYRACDSDSFERLRRHTSELEERCHLLESRVAELSLENHRLRMVTSANRHSLAYFSFAIPKAIQRTSSGRSRRPFHVYEIRISPTGGGAIATADVGQAILMESSSSTSWCLYRRYNEFYRLHKRLQRDYPTAKTLDFPPKKKLGNMNVDFVEQRRQRLQVYLNSLFAVVLPEVLSCRTRAQLEQVFPFFCDDRL